MEWIAKGDIMAKLIAKIFRDGTVVLEGGTNEGEACMTKANVFINALGNLETQDDNTDVDPALETVEANEG